LCNTDFTTNRLVLRRENPKKIGGGNILNEFILFFAHTKRWGTKRWGIKRWGLQTLGLSEAVWDM
jgi:hypothetical protein